MADPVSPRSLLARARVVVAPADYVLVGLPLPDAAGLAAALEWQAGGALSLTRDAYEVSAVLPADTWEALATRLPAARVAGPYRLLTFDLVLDFAVVGFLAAVGAALAARGVSIYALSAYSRDHLLVRSDDLPVALDALTALATKARWEEAADA